MSGVNQATVLGNLGGDPEIRYLENGTAVTRISVATSEKWKDKNTQETKESVEWHSITAFGRLAEVIGEYCRKGSKVYIQGKLKTSSWEQDGQKKYRTEIVARELQMLDSKGQQSDRPPNPPDEVIEKNFEDDIPF